MGRGPLQRYAKIRTTEISERGKIPRSATRVAKCATVADNWAANTTSTSTRHTPVRDYTIWVDKQTVASVASAT